MDEVIKGSFFRRVFANVDVKTFELFRERSYIEGMKIGEAFSALVYAYAHGYGFEDGKKNNLREHAPSRSIDYQKEVNTEK